MRIEKPCETCGTIVSRKPSQASGPKRGHVFCGRACYGKWRANEIRGEKHHHHSPRMPIFCETCGVVLLRTAAYIKKHAHHFCSPKCKGAWQSQFSIGVANPRYIGAMQTYPCAWCNKPIQKYQSQAAPYAMQFCNERCMGDWKSEYCVAEKNPHWTGGPIKYYGPNWLKQQRATRKRDSYKCRACGLPQRKHGRALHVHHIKPFKTFGYIYGQNDHYLQANDPTNLITLCGSCHTRAEHHKIAIQPYLL